MDSDAKEHPTNRYELKDPVVKLERCDKIWKTLQLIRKMQDKHIEDIQDWIKREPITTPEITTSEKPPMTFIPDKSLPLNLIGEPNLPKPYIKYQPIFSNGDESLPLFKLAEKSRVNLYHCEVCSQEYCDYKTFIDHREDVHGIVMPKKAVARKEKIQNSKNNGDLKTRRNSFEINQNQSINKKSVSDENIDMQTGVKNSSSQADSVRCRLCGKYYKNIKKHMIDYHKIKYIDDVLSKVTDRNSNIDKDQTIVKNATVNSSSLLRVVKQAADQTDEIISSNVNLTVQNITANVPKRKLNMPSIGVRKRLRSVGSCNEESSDTANQDERFDCDTCGREFANYKALCKHRDRHKKSTDDRLSLDSMRNFNESADVAPKQKTNTEVVGKCLLQANENDNNNIDNRTPRTRSNFAKDRRNSDQSDKGTLQIKCACGRAFRTTSILATHRFGCKYLNDKDKSKTSEARNAGGDKDLGISITIKKKNNSYEIVSKEVSEAELTKDSHSVQEPEICGESSDSSSDTSDSSDFDDHLENLIPEQSKYSIDHRVLKLKLVEDDVEVDVEGEIGKANSSTSSENDENIHSYDNGHEVPLLRTLCKKIFVAQGIMPKEGTSHKCESCEIFLGSEEKLSKHIERHKKLMKRSCSCGIKFNAVKIFDDHIAKEHPNSIVCPYCKEKFKSIVALGEHSCIVDCGAEYTESYSENYPCPYCNITYTNITWLDSHMRSKHLDPKLPFQCYQCLEKFANEKERSLHSNKRHNVVSSCSVCNQKFQSVKTKQKHEAYHCGVGFPCHNCKKTYRTKKNQLNHVRTVHSDFSNDKLKCSICEKSVKMKSVKKHVLRHNSVLKCELCDKVVYEFRHLERHIIDCHDNGNYPRKKCSVCGVSFATQLQLDVHIMIKKSLRNERYEDV